MIPRSRIVRFKYAINGGDGHSLESTSGALADYVYRANSCYDPYYGTGGHQPYGFDQMMALWRYGVVLGSKIKVTFSFPDAATSNKPFRCGVLLSRNASTLSTANDEKVVNEDPRSKSMTLNPIKGGATMVQTYSYRFGDGKKPVDDDGLRFGVAADCSDGTYFHIFGMGLNGQSQNVVISGVIEYVCRLFDPQTLTPS